MYYYSKHKFIGKHKFINLLANLYTRLPASQAKGYLMHSPTKTEIQKLWCIYSYFNIIKVVHEQSGKVEYERERLLGTALKIH
jgi:hypothetical protein